MKQTLILKTIVGSQAHGLATPESDFDYRGVFVVPTSEILKVGVGTPKQTAWIEGGEDDTSWEIGKFLHLATKCNPTILETFLSPIAPHTGDLTVFMNQNPIWKDRLRELFPHVWNSTGVKDAFIGYGLNQRKKFFDDKDSRAPKYAAAYLRTLYNAWELLATGSFTIRIVESEIGETVRKFKNGDYTRGEVIDATYYWETKVLEAYKANPDKKTNLEPVNEFLLDVRKSFWE